jgi:hypothetical protein
VEQAVLDISLTFTLQAQEDTQDTLVDQELLQKVLQVEDQDGQIQMTLGDVHREDRVVQECTDLLAVAEDQEEEQAEAVQMVADRVTETTLEHQEQMQCQTQVLAEAAVAETLVVQESARLHIG